MNFATYTFNRDYFLFNAEKVNKLDLNTITDDSVVVFPNNLYKGEPVMEPHFTRDPVDTNTVYWLTMGERVQHPLHLSKFGRRPPRGQGECPFGYCYGAQSGRNYNLPPGCHNKVFSGVQRTKRKL